MSILDRLGELEAEAAGPYGEPDDATAERLALEWVVKQHASVHASHPDWRDEWRP